MTLHARLTLILVCLTCSLSCAIWQPDATAPEETVAHAATDPTRPTAVEFIEARFQSFHASLSSTEIRQVAEAVVQESIANDLSWELVLAVIHTESGYHNFAISDVGALGLMQIMPATGEGLARTEDVSWHGPETLFQPLVNVKLGTRYLAWLRNRYGDWGHALAAYNWGPGHIDQRLRRGSAMPIEYVNKVMAQVQSPVAP